MSLIARHLEATGLPTLCLSSALDITEAGRPPRAVFVDYPLGHTAGVPFDRADQRAIVRAALDAFASMDTPGSILRLPQAWPDGDAWKGPAAAADVGDTRQPRDSTPRYQCDADRLAAAASGAT